jgi:hypothetical protein
MTEIVVTLTKEDLLQAAMNKALETTTVQSGCEFGEGEMKVSMILDGKYEDQITVTYRPEAEF